MSTLIFWHDVYDNTYVFPKSHFWVTSTSFWLLPILFENNKQFLSIVCPEDFKWNEIESIFNYTYLLWVKEYTSEVQNIFCLKSWNKGHENGQLGSLADLFYFL